MDTKSITWIGNIYQKFEAMCLEVEEIMYRDSTKFVEDPGKVTASENTMDKWDDSKTYKSKTTFIKRVSSNTGPNRFTKGSNVVDPVKKDGVHASSVKRLNIHRKPSSNSTRDAQLMEKEGKNESRFVTAAETQPPSEALWVVPPSERTEVYSLQVLSGNPKAIEQRGTIVCSADVEMARGCSIKASINENGQQNGPIDDLSPNILPTNTTSSSCWSDSEGTYFRNAVMPVTASSDAIESSCFKIPVNADDADMGHIRSNSPTEHNLLTLDKPDRGNLEDSCIFIDVDGHHSISRSSAKQRSYKKTIRSAFSSKKAASRAREYEQLTVPYDDAISAEDCSAESGKGVTLEARGSSECDWELL